MAEQYVHIFHIVTRENRFSASNLLSLLSHLAMPTKKNKHDIINVLTGKLIGCRSSEALETNISITYQV